MAARPENKSWADKSLFVAVAEYNPALFAFLLTRSTDLRARSQDGQSISDVLRSVGRRSLTPEQRKAVGSMESLLRLYYDQFVKAKLPNCRLRSWDGGSATSNTPVARAFASPLDSGQRKRLSARNFTATLAIVQLGALRFSARPASAPDTLEPSARWQGPSESRGVRAPCSANKTAFSMQRDPEPIRGGSASCLVVERHKQHGVSLAIACPTALAVYNANEPHTACIDGDVTRGERAGVGGQSQRGTEQGLEPGTYALLLRFVVAITTLSDMMCIGIETRNASPKRNNQLSGCPVSSFCALDWVHARIIPLGASSNNPKMVQLHWQLTLICPWNSNDRVAYSVIGMVEPFWGY
jgi:hypothetical protein